MHGRRTNAVLIWRTGSIDGLEPVPETDPYAPLGLRIGTFTVTPTLETGLTVTDNALSSPVKQSGIFSDTTLRLEAVSGWLRHEARLNAFATWRQAVSGPGESEPSIGIDGQMRLDFGADHAVNASAGYELRREAAESPVSIPAGATRPLLHLFTFLLQNFSLRLLMHPSPCAAARWPRVSGLMPLRRH